MLCFDLQMLAQPVLNRLFFAGDATSDLFFGTAHGALVSGWREAARISRVRDILPTMYPTGARRALRHRFNHAHIAYIYRHNPDLLMRFDFDGDGIVSAEDVYKASVLLKEPISRDEAMFLVSAGRPSSASVAGGSSSPFPGQVRPTTPMKSLTPRVDRDADNSPQPVRHVRGVSVPAMLRLGNQNSNSNGGGLSAGYGTDSPRSGGAALPATSAPNLMHSAQPQIYAVKPGVAAADRARNAVQTTTPARRPTTPLAEKAVGVASRAPNAQLKQPLPPSIRAAAS